MEPCVFKRVKDPDTERRKNIPDFFFFGSPFWTHRLPGKGILLLNSLFLFVLLMNHPVRVFP